MGNYGTENGVPVTSLRTTFTGSDKGADDLVDIDEEPAVILLARLRPTGKVTFVPTETDGEKRPTAYERQQVLQLVGYDLLRRDKGNTKLYDDLAKRIVKATADRAGELTFEED